MNGAQMIYGGFEIVLGVAAFFTAYVYWTGTGDDVFWRGLSLCMATAGVAAFAVGVGIMTGKI